GMAVKEPGEDTDLDRRAERPARYRRPLGEGRKARRHDAGRKRAVRGLEIAVGASLIGEEERLRRSDRLRGFREGARIVRPAVPREALDGVPIGCSALLDLLLALVDDRQIGHAELPLRRGVAGAQRAAAAE